MYKNIAKIVQLDQYHSFFPSHLNYVFIKNKLDLSQQHKSIIIMGTKNSKQKNQEKHILPELPDMYTEISSQHDSISHPELPAVKKYMVLLNKHEKEDYEMQLKFRQEHRQQLIQIMYGEVLQDRKQYFKAKIYVEDMVLTIYQLQNVHFLDMMAIFHKAFKGFQILFKQFGPFETDPRMICFNEEAIVKVWANIKYSKPKPKLPYRMLDQKLMVESLVEIFMNKVDLDTIQIDSRRRRFKFEAKTFEEVIKFIQNQVESVDLIPKSINAVKNLLISDRKIAKDEIISMNSEFYCGKLQKTVKFSYSKERQHSLDRKNVQPKVNFSFGRQIHEENRQKHSKSLNKFPNSQQNEDQIILKSACIKISSNKIDQFLQTPSKNTEKDTQIQSQISQGKTIKKEKSKASINFTYKK